MAALSVKQKLLCTHWMLSLLMLVLTGTLASLWFTQDQARRLDEFLLRESRGIQDLLNTYLAVGGMGGQDSLTDRDFGDFLDNYFQERVNRAVPYKTTLGVFDALGQPVKVTNSALSLSPAGYVFSSPEAQLVTVEGNPESRLSVVPLVFGGHLLGTVRLACLTVTLAEVWDSFLLSLVFVLAVLYFAFGLLGTALVHWSLRPVRLMSVSAKDISDAHLDLRLLVPPGSDEIAQMASTLNQLLEKLERDFQFEEALVGQLSHELRTPLAILRARNEVALERQNPDSDDRAILEDNLADIDTIVSLLTSLLDLARMEGRKDLVEWKTCDLREVFRGLLEELSPLWAEKLLSVQLSLPGPSLTWSSAPPLLTKGDPVLLRQVFLNLLTNAYKYTPPRNTIWLSIDLEGDPKNLCWCIVVRNPGPSIPEESLELVFKRFYRLEMQDPDSYELSSGLGQRGFGLGLSIAKTMVELQNGRIRAYTPTSGGAAFEVLLPRAVEAPSHAQNPSHLEIRSQS